MKALHIVSTEITPMVILDLAQDKFEIKGSSRPENAIIFYQPVLNWLNAFNSEKKNPKTPIYFSCDFDYLNSISVKLLFDCFKVLEKIDSKTITILWHYNKGDIDMKETGEEYSKLISIPFSYIAK